MALPVDKRWLREKMANPDFAAVNPGIASGGKGVPAPVSDFKRVKGAAPKKKTRPEAAVEALLMEEKQRGGIAAFGFETITLVIGEPPTRYTPDFTVWLPNGRLRFIEAKGPHIREDAFVKFKCAKLQFPLAEFQLWQRNKHGELRRLI